MIKVILVALLIVAAIRAYRGREHYGPPAWLEGLEHETPLRAFSLGMGLLSVFPSDLVRPAG